MYFVHEDVICLPGLILYPIFLVIIVITKCLVLQSVEYTDITLPVCSLWLPIAATLAITVKSMFPVF